MYTTPDRTEAPLGAPPRTPPRAQAPWEPCFPSREGGVAPSRDGFIGGLALIAGVGIDLCRISRMLRAVRSRHFVERVFRPEEIVYAEAKGGERARAASYA
ncbi:MAG: hypothetical protein ACFNW0_05835, partial [Fretibacterium sp.]